MVLRKIKYSKIAVVVFLTVLIWVWADLATNEVSADKPATIVVDESANPKLWVSFGQAPSADIRITLSGPHSAIADEDTRLRQGRRLEFDFNASQEEMDKPGDHDLRLLPFLQKDRQLKRLGLKIESCEPEILDVNVVELVSKSLIVECVDEDRIPLRTESIDPPKVDMLVPVDWAGEKLTAQVRLTPGEIEQARAEPIERRPYVELAPSQTREATTTVKIKVSPEEDPRSDYIITGVKLGILLSPTLLGQYVVEVDNLPEVIGAAITIRATLEARRAYEQMRYQVTLEIGDEDTRSTETLRRELIYNFPDDYVGRGEIELKQPPVTALFRLKPLPSAESP